MWTQRVPWGPALGAELPAQAERPPGSAEAGRRASGEAMSEALKLDRALEQAAAQNADVVMSTPYTLLLDLDTVAGEQQFARNLPVVQEYYHVELKDTWPSKSGAGHRHVVLELGQPLPLQDRVLLQAILGSDPKREMLSFIRLKNEPEREPDTMSMLFRPRA